MKALVTGGAGFIGSHLCERLLENGDEVYVVDDLSTGTIANIQHLKTHPDFHYQIDSITNQKLMAELVDLCDITYHLAAAVGVRLSVDSPVRTMETNIRGTEIVLALAEQKRKRVLITSTSEVYGKREQIPFREDDDLVMGPTNKGRWSYACSKAIDEFLALAYHREKELPAIIVRMFNTVGPRQVGRYGMVVPRLVDQALAGEPLTVYGDGRQTRCFGYVGDAVKSLMLLMDHPDTAGEIFNVGTTDEVSINHLAERILGLTGSSSKIVHVPYEQAYEAGFEDMPRRVPDTSKAARVIGFTPRTSLEDILRSVIAERRAHARRDPVGIRSALPAVAG